MSRTPVLVALLLALVVSACGGDDLGDVGGGDTAPTTALGGGDDADGEGTTGPGFGQVVEGSIDLSGAVDAGYALPSDDFEFIVAGGCQGDQFGVQIQIRQDGQTLLNVGAGAEADLDGGELATLAIDRVRLTQFVQEDGSLRAVEYRGPGTLDITTHEAPNELNERRMGFTLTAPNLEGDDDQLLGFVADILWVMGCP
ncbi:MAG: hypothetical protein R3290_10195 [Acidimicrobiia bacterium]|nr:hypothetical protein [Acidimicrobiia bacterium]